VTLFLLAWADKLIELKTICQCGRKANRVLCRDDTGKPLRDGQSVCAAGAASAYLIDITHYYRPVAVVDPRGC